MQERLYSEERKDERRDMILKDLRCCLARLPLDYNVRCCCEPESLCGTLRDRLVRSSLRTWFMASSSQICYLWYCTDIYIINIQPKEDVRDVM